MVLQDGGHGEVRFSFLGSHDGARLAVRVSHQEPGDVAEMLDGTGRPSSGNADGLASARRLVDRCEIRPCDDGVEVMLEKALAPAFMPTAGVVDAIRRMWTPAVDPTAELQTQNRELLGVLEQLRLRKDELEQVNEELAETNRGVVALYDELDTLHQVASMVAAQLDLDKLLAAVTRAAVEITGAEVAAFLSHSPAGLALVCLEGPLAGEIPPGAIFPERQLLGNLAADESLLREADILLHDSVRWIVPEHEVRSYLGIRVEGASGASGMLVCGHRRTDFFTERSERIMGSVASQLAVGIDKARLYQSMQVANAAKDQFLALLSHELRTPLNPALMLASRLENDARLPTEIRADLTVLKRNLDLEARLIDDLLDITRIAKGKLKLSRHPVELHSLLDGVVAIFRSDMEEKGLALAVELHAEESYVSADPARLQQVFWNLLRNAIKFTPAGGSIQLTSHVEPGGHVLVRLSDSGRGIDPAVLPRIFDAFEQGGFHIPEQFGGLGLGLAISQALVLEHEGRIFAESAGEGLGSCFVVELPTCTPPPASASPCGSRVEADARAQQYSILVVDDHQDTLFVMQALLSQWGFHVHPASSVQHALAIAAENSIDLLVSDIGLPDGSGLDLMRTLKASRGIWGIALSGYGMPQNLHASTEAGFDQHLTKPIDLAQLRQAIDDLLAH